jgi:alkanesulfonate monooxygenase SsuD/methylene tetrahydromethanopterin reductase-like flavin-dependent oxidoreductase (luciferase family)
MKVGLLQEGDISNNVSVAQRYKEMIQEVILADKLGFSCWGTSEQHFSPPRFTVSAPEVLYAAVAAQTEQIKIRIMAAVLLSWNHPILVAERLATLDIVSGGRAEICTARSNNKHTLEAFGVSPQQTKVQWREGMEVLAKALTQDVLEHDGDVWKIPPREIVPRALQQPHPPLSVAASSISSHLEAGEKGLGVIGFENYFGWDYLQQCIDAYREGIKNPVPLTSMVNNYLGLFVSTAYCAENRQQAIEEASDIILGYFKFILDLYRPLAKDPSYEYMEQINELIGHENDLEFLVEHSPSILVGDPDTIIQKLKRLERMGVDEVLLRIDGFGHERNIRAIELIGKHVIPYVSEGSRIVT